MRFKRNFGNNWKNNEDYLQAGVESDAMLLGSIKECISNQKSRMVRIGNSSDFFVKEWVHSSVTTRVNCLDGVIDAQSKN
jgi:hypothetical protein